MTHGNPPSPRDPHDDVRIVDWRRFRDLLVSRRQLERVEERPDTLHDRETDEFFALDPRSEHAVA